MLGQQTEKIAKVDKEIGGIEKVMSVVKFKFGLCIPAFINDDHGLAAVSSG